jgi:hypothetical protein
MKETDAKEDRLSIAAYNTHHRSAAHTDPRFYPQGPKQMEPAQENTASVLIRGHQEPEPEQGRPAAGLGVMGGEVGR